MKSPSVPPKQHLGCIRWVLKIIIAMCIFIMGFLAIGYLIQAVGLRNDTQRFQPPGQIITINNHNFHLWCMGEATSNPTIIVESGIGRASLDWGHVLPLISAQTRICAYDRAGYAWSSITDTPRTLNNISQELHQLLMEAKITKPFVMIGHSYGGAVVRHYTTLYPKEVAGLILVDAMHEQEWVNASPEEQQYVAEQTGKLKVISLLNQFGLLRMFGSLLGSDALPVPIGSLEEHQQAAYLSFLLRADYYDTWLNEILALQGATLPSKLPHDIPLLILTANSAAPLNQQNPTEINHLELQKAFLALSNQSKQLFVDCGHDIPLECPDQIVRAVEAIQAKLP